MNLLEESNELLKFSVIGNVDDGKSTMIGRLLFDTKNIFDDQIFSIKTASKRRGEDFLNLALVADGLKAEREQGITIDVAHKYFSTENRKFIIADCPGHKQYTRNMVTGTSSADASVLLIDARNGLKEQTKRHAAICSLMKTPHLIVCINKMDLVTYSEAIFKKITVDLSQFLESMRFESIHFLPISALTGENVVEQSNNMSWYHGSTLLEILESLPVPNSHIQSPPRFSIQRVIRPMTKEWQDFRGYAGRVESGTYRVGDEVTVLPSGICARIQKIYWQEKEIPEASKGMSILITLDMDLDLSRGGMIVKKDSLPKSSQEIDLVVCWFSEKPLQLNGQYFLKHLTNETKAKISHIDFKLNIEDMSRQASNSGVEINDLAKIRIQCAENLFFDSYEMNRSTGSLILIDPVSNSTVASGIIVS